MLPTTIAATLRPASPSSGERISKKIVASPTTVTHNNVDGCSTASPAIASRDTVGSGIGAGIDGTGRSAGCDWTLAMCSAPGRVIPNTDTLSGKSGVMTLPSGTMLTLRPTNPRRSSAVASEVTVDPGAADERSLTTKSTTAPR